MTQELQFWKGEKTLAGVLMLNILFPGLGLVYAGGLKWAWALPVILTFLFWVVIDAPRDNVVTLISLASFLTSLLGCGMVGLARLERSLRVGNPGPNTSDLASRFGNGQISHSAVAALDTLEEKVRKADEQLRLARPDDDQRAEKKTISDLKDMQLPKPTPIIEERPQPLVRDTPHSQDQSKHGKLTLPPDKDAVPREPATPEPTYFAPPVERPFESPVKPEIDLSVEENFAPPAEAQSEFAKSEFTPPVEDNFSEPIFTLGVDTELPPSALDGSSESTKGDTVADQKFALSIAQSPEQVQKFFDKLGETVGTSYQQERLSKPSFDISFPSFESPNFSFDFSSALNSDFSSIAGTNQGEPDQPVDTDKCQRCGAIKQTDFSFCLGCGISF
ncbi:MAG: hypothetical protein SGJ27_14420 [Candidatus Melainabacteria bacterium]|nr:hypothetical protein [Candidatus Melainabacteria bacterium]